MKLPYWKHILIFFWSVLILSLGYTSVVFQVINDPGSTSSLLVNGGAPVIVKVDTSENFSGKPGLNTSMQWAEEEEVHNANNLFLNSGDNFYRGVSALKFSSCPEIFIHSILIRLLDRPPDSLSD